MADIKKVFVAVHGIGEQTNNATIQAVVLGIKDWGLVVGRSNAQSLILNPEYLAWNCTSDSAPGGGSDPATVCAGAPRAAMRAVPGARREE